jgi:hypothetical protein
MSMLSTKINGFTVELDTDMDGDGQCTGCWISKGKFSASLACAEDTWQLADMDTGRVYQMHPKELKTISDWAVAHGY